MAFSLTERINSNSGTSSAGSRVSSSFTPTANSRLFVFASAERDDHTATRNWQISDSLGTLSWTKLDESALTNWGAFWATPQNYALNVVCWYTDIGASPSPMTVTVDASTDNEFYAVVGFDVTGFDSGTPFAQASVDNAVNSGNASGSNTLALTLTLGSAPTSGNLVVAMFGSGADGGGGFAVPSGYTALRNQNNSYAQAAVFYNVATTTAAVTCSDLGQSVGNGGGIVFEMTLASAGPTYTLTAAQGSFALSGQTTNLLASRLLTAAQASFSLAGQAANLLQNRLLTAAHGEFALSGQDANLLASRLLTAEQGDFVLSGQDVNLTISRLLTASQGSFALSGQDTGLFVSRLLTAVYGAFALSGQDATLTYNPVGGYTLTAGQGSFTLSGQAANLLTSRLLTAAHGSFSLSGQAANLTVSRLLTASQGSFALSGQDASLLVSRLLTAVYGAFTVSGQDVTLAYNPAGSYTLTAAQGSFTLSGQAVNLLTSRLLTAAYGEFVLSGQDVTLAYNPAGSYTLTAESGSFTLSGQAANLLTSRLLTAAHGEFVLSGQDTGLLRAFNLAAGQGAFTLSGQNANLLASRLLTAVYGSFVLSGQAVTFDYSGVVLQIYLATVLAQLSPSFTVAANPLPSADVPIATPSREVQIG